MAEITEEAVARAMAVADGVPPDECEIDVDGDKHPPNWKRYAHFAKTALPLIAAQVREEDAKSLEDAASGQEFLGEVHAANILRYKAAAIRALGEK